MPYNRGTTPSTPAQIPTFLRAELAKIQRALQAAATGPSEGANALALDGLVGAADKVPYFTGLSAMALASLTPFARTILACADLAALDAILDLGTLAFLNTATEANITLADVLTNNVSITKHGLVPKAPNDTSKFLRGDGTWAAPASSGSAPAWVTDDDRTAPAVPNALDDEFEGAAGTAINAAWTAVNSNVNATAVLDGAGRLLLTGDLLSTDSLRMWVKTPPATPWSIISRITPVNLAASPRAGLVVRNSTSGKLIMFAACVQGAFSIQVKMERWTSATVFSAALGASATSIPALLQPTYYKITNDGTTLKFWLSFLGTHASHWLQISSDALASFIGSVDQVGVLIDSKNAAAAGIGLFDFFRVTA